MSGTQQKTSRRLQLPRHAYPLDSGPASRQDLLNLFAEPQPPDVHAEAISQTATMILRSTPGATPNWLIGSGPITALSDLHGLLYVVSGATAARIGTGGVGPVVLGTVLAVDSATIAIGPNEAIICTPPNAYICNHGGTITQITAAGLPPVSSVCYQDGYFIFSEVGSGRVHFSQLTSGGDFDPLSFASLEAMPDVLIRVVAHGGVIWLFGHDALEIWQDVGAVPVPYQRASGGVIYIGTISPASIASLDNQLCWLGRDGIVYQTNGYQPKRISTFALEQTIRVSYGDFQNARGMSYTQEGHQFYALTFPTPSKTWVYDAATQLWHRRSSDSAGAGRWLANCSAQFGQLPVIGDYLSGSICLLEPHTDNDKGARLERQMLFPPVSQEAKRVFMHRLEIELETGTALTPDNILLDWSDDGGYSFGPVRTLTTAPNTGLTRRRAYTNRLGSFRERMLRLRMNGVATIYAADADMDAAGS